MLTIYSLDNTPFPLYKHSTQWRTVYIVTKYTMFSDVLVLGIKSNTNFKSNIFFELWRVDANNEMNQITVKHAYCFFLVNYGTVLIICFDVQTKWIILNIMCYKNLITFYIISTLDFTNSIKHFKMLIFYLNLAVDVIKYHYDVPFPRIRCPCHQNYGRM